MTLDGTTIHSVDNSDARVFNDVRVLAGDDFAPEADATYKNLVWENLQSKHLIFYFTALCLTYNKYILNVRNSLFDFYISP